MSVNSVMVDIETMGISSQSVIASIGACEFNLNTGAIGDTFYRVIEMQSCLDAGLKVDASTIYFWLKQDDVPRLELCSQLGVSLKVALWELSKFLPSDVTIWCHATFDVPILVNAYRACGIREGWHYTHVRDIRTLTAMWREVSGNSGFPKTQGEETVHGREPHKALPDAIAQAEYCSVMWRDIVEGTYR